MTTLYQHAVRIRLADLLQDRLVCAPVLNLLPLPPEFGGGGTVKAPSSLACFPDEPDNPVQPELFCDARLDLFSSRLEHGSCTAQKSWLH